MGNGLELAAGPPRRVAPRLNRYEAVQLRKMAVDACLRTLNIFGPAVEPTEPTELTVPGCVTLAADWVVLYWMFGNRVFLKI